MTGKILDPRGGSRDHDIDKDQCHGSHQCFEEGSFRAYDREIDAAGLRLHN